MTNRGFAAVVASLALGAFGCGAAGDGEDLGTEVQAVVAGSNAQPVSNTIPTSLAPGERLAVQVVMKNTGLASPTNDWPFPSNFALYRTNNLWSWVSTKTSAAVPVGSNATFNFIITAPTTPGTYAFGAQMRLTTDPLPFGQALSIPSILVDGSVTPQWSCTWDGAGVPASLAPGETRTLSLQLTNSGAQTWQSSNFYLRSQDSPVSFWAGGTAVPLTQAVAPGQTTTVSFPITAPATPGTYSLKRQLSDLSAGGIGFFSGSCVDANITVGGVPPLDSALVSQNFPTTMAVGDKANIAVTLTNTGTTSWANDGNFVLYSRNSPTSLWATTVVPVTSVTNQGAQYTFNFTITAPSTPGSYVHAWRMRKLSGTDAAFFGVSLNVPVTVDNMSTPAYASSLVTQTIPTRMVAGRSGQFKVTFKNTGTLSWSGTNFGASSTNTPVSLWGVTSSRLGAAETIAAGDQREFTLNVTAPPTAGTYQSRWTMRDFSAAGTFGTEAVASVDVTLCGNNVVDAGEVCDDGNWVNGDGCSDVCAREARIVTLASQAADRTIIGSQTNKQLASVAIGDVTNSGTPSIVVSENRNLVVGGGSRNTAGAVTGYAGGSGFLTGASTSVTSGFAFEILGDTAGDHLGDYAAGGMDIADVTGDGVADLVIAAPGGDGVSDARVDAGEVYVLTGGSGLTGSIDLRTVPTVLKARIIGELAGDALRLLGIGDVTGDGVQDLILGSLAEGGGGGAAYVVAGGASLSGDVDLAAPGSVVVYKITGLASGAALGSAAAVGDFGGSASNDLLLGAANSAPGGKTNAGAAYGVFGPITGNVDLGLSAGTAGGPDVVWLGQGANDKFGLTVAIGDVTGDSIGDALIGASQARKSGNQVGTVDIWSGAIASGTTYDLTVALPHARLLGRDAFDTNGSAIAVGDWTGDGVMDIATTAPSGDGLANNVDGAGELLVIRGGASLAGSIDLSTAFTELEVYGAASRDLLGGRANALAMGRIDGDARADICVGSQKGGTGGGLTAPGRVDCFRAGN